MTADAPPPRRPTAFERISDPRTGTWRDPRILHQQFGERARPGGLLVAVFIAVAISEIFTGGPRAWGVSAAALAEGRWYTLLSHAFAHASLMHLWMNSGALLAMTSPLMLRLGTLRQAWVRFAVIYFGAGVCAVALFLALNPQDAVPMVGASGAICGVWGALTRIDPDGSVVPLRSRAVWKNLREFAVMNVILFLVLFGLAWSAGAQGGLAWEAHLGGFLFGLFMAPYLAVRPADPPPSPPEPPLLQPPTL